MSHNCPVTLPGGQRCSIVIRNDDILMDPAHWKQVPHELQVAVYAAWRRGEGRGTPELQAAQDAAITAVNTALLGQASTPQPHRRP